MAFEVLLKYHWYDMGDEPEAEMLKDLLKPLQTESLIDCETIIGGVLTVRVFVVLLIDPHELEITQ